MPKDSNALNYAAAVISPGNLFLQYTFKLNENHDNASTESIALIFLNIKFGARYPYFSLYC